MSASGRIHATIGNQDAKIRVLYINPNSSISMTNESAEYFKDKIAPDLRLDFYTAPETAPPSIDGTHDGILSTAVVLQDLGLNSRLEEERSDFLPVTYDTIIVGCFSAHPLLPALQECLPSTPKTPPVLGIMESAIYTALQLAPAFGIVTTGFNWEPLFVSHLRTMGIAESRITGVKGTGFNAISLHGNSVNTAILDAAEELVKKGAGAIVLGCGGMAPLRQELETALAKRTGKHTYLIDGVQAAIESAAGMARMKMAARPI